MGEYIKHILKGELKLGTCEDLYYTTIQQFKNELPFFKKMNGNDDPENYLQPNTYRFRFPFPDEDKIEIGGFQDYQRGILFQVPVSDQIAIAHSNMFIEINSRTAKPTNEMRKAFNAICPQDPEKEQINKYFAWSNLNILFFEIVQQKIVQDEHTGGKIEIQTVVRCPYCGSVCRLSLNELYYIKDTYLGSGFNEDTIEIQILNIAIKGYNQE